MNFLVVFRNKQGKIQKANVDDVDNHIEAINEAKKILDVKTVLALISNIKPTFALV